MANLWIALVCIAGITCYFASFLTARNDKKKALHAAQKAAKGRGFRD